MRTCVITGASGFIGRHLVAALRGLSWQVTCWTEDVSHIARLDTVVDVVFHLAAKSREEQFVGAHTAYAVNILGTQAVLDYCRRAGAHLVFASTSGVYQMPAHPQPLTETAPVRPVSPYALSKWLAEGLCAQAIQQGGSACVLRIFNCYGVGQHAAFIIPSLLESLQCGRPLVLKMPHAVRDFVFVEDVVRAMICAADRPHHQGVVNIGTGQATSIMQLVGVLEELCDRRAIIETSVVAPTTELHYSVADATLAQTRLAWTPSYTLVDGLRTMLTAAPSRVDHV